jgi:hypothetical protein
MERNRSVSEGADLDGARGGGFEPRDAERPRQTKNAETGTEALLGMRLCAHDRFEQRERRRTDLLGFAREARWCPLGIAPVRASAARRCRVPARVMRDDITQNPDISARLRGRLRFR